jgi:hypothetical protein
MEGKEFERGETLIVVHGHDGIVMAFDGGVEDGVAGHRHDTSRPSARSRSDGRGDEPDFFVAQVTFLAGVRVEAADTDPSAGRPKSRQAATESRTASSIFAGVMAPATSRRGRCVVTRVTRSQRCRSS